MQFFDILYFIFPLIIASAVPLAIVALGGLYSERSGVVNIALEGIMIMGGFVGVVIISSLETSKVGAFWIVIVSLMLAAFVGYVLFIGLRYLLDKIDKASLLESKFAFFVSYGVLAILSFVLVYIVMNNASEVVQISMIGLVFGALAGLVFSLFHAFASINMKANQIISATALNMFAPAITLFLARNVVNDNVKQISLAQSYKIDNVGFLADIPFIGDLFFKDAYLSTYLGVAIFLVAVIVLYKTRFGLRLRSCGENPHAADSLGINIYKIRYFGVMVSGALAGMGGVIFALSFSQGFVGTVTGFGFLALAVLIFGNWKPGKIIYAALFFATLRTLSSTYGSIDFLKNLTEDSNIYNMAPYIATLIVLAFVSKNSAAPRAAGEPFDPGKR